MEVNNEQLQWADYVCVYKIYSLEFWFKNYQNEILLKSHNRPH